MAWSPKFIADLTLGTQAPQFIVRGLLVSEAPGALWEIRGPQPQRVTSHALVQGVQVSGSRVSTDSWAATTGSVSIRLVGNISELLKHMHRGQVVEVLAGFQGYGDADYQAIALGQVFDLTRSSDALEYTLTLRDIWAALSSRISTTADELALFAGLPSETTVKANYTAGAGTIDITDSDEFPKETGGNGCFSVVSTAGDTFYVTWSSSAALSPGRRYTIVSADALGGTDANAAAGKAVQALAYIKDEPPDIVRKVLASTGAGTNGAWDTLPKTWGMGIPDRLIDHGDLDRTAKYSIPSSGSGEWEAWASDTQSSPISWLFGTVLQTGGYFPVVNQGRMSIRCSLNVYDASTAFLVTSQRTDRPFIDDRFLSVNPLESWSAWSQDHPVEYYRFSAISDGVTRSLIKQLGALPADDTRTADVGRWIFNNTSLQLYGIRDRNAHWAMRLPERFTVRLADLNMAVHSPGSLPLLNSSILHGRLADTVHGFDNMPAFVTQVSIDWMTRTMSLGFEVYSSKDSDF